MYHSSAAVGRQPVDVPGRVDFTPRLGMRRAVTVLALLNTASASYVGWLAWSDREPNTIGIAITLSVLALVLWGLIASSAPTRISIDRGELVARGPGGTEHYEIGNPHEQVTVDGQPGDRHWKVQVWRHDRAALTIDRRLVDPFHFTRVLHAYRPDLATTGRHVARPGRARD